MSQKQDLQTSAQPKRQGASYNQKRFVNLLALTLAVAGTLNSANGGRAKAPHIFELAPGNSGDEGARDEGGHQIEQRRLGGGRDKVDAKTGAEAEDVRDDGGAEVRAGGDEGWGAGGVAVLDEVGVKGEGEGHEDARDAQVAQAEDGEGVGRGGGEGGRVAGEEELAGRVNFEGDGDHDAVAVGREEGREEDGEDVVERQADEEA